MALEMDEKLIANIGKLEQFLSKESKKELEEILAFGEKYKKKGDILKKQFWEVCFQGSEEMEKQFRYKRLNFVKRLLQYGENEQNFVLGLDDKEQKIIKGLGGNARTMFFKEYFYDWILYSGDIKDSYGRKLLNYSDEKLSFMEVENLAKTYENILQPGMEINFADANLSLISLKIIVEKWRGKLKPWMCINFYKNDIGDAGIKKLVKEWKDSLQPGFKLDLGINQIGDEGIKSLSEEWKNKLQVGMNLSLSGNRFGLNGFNELLKGWKDGLQPGMTLNFGRNKIGDEGADLLVDERKDRLQPGMSLCLRSTGIGDEGAKAIAQKIELKDGVELDLTSNYAIDDEGKKALQECVERHRAQGINCRILFY